MQPLAIQQHSSPIDAGEPSTAGTNQSGSSSSVDFNDLMSAVRTAANERRASENEAAARRSEDQKEAASAASAAREAEGAVAALTAAAQFAARNVKLKQRAAADAESNAQVTARENFDKNTAEAIESKLETVTKDLKEDTQTDPQSDPSSTSIAPAMKMSVPRDHADNADTAAEMAPTNDDVLLTRQNPAFQEKPSITVQEGKIDSPKAPALTDHDLDLAEQMLHQGTAESEQKTDQHGQGTSEIAVKNLDAMVAQSDQKTNAETSINGHIPADQNNLQNATPKLSTQIDDQAISDTSTELMDNEATPDVDTSRTKETDNKTRATEQHLKAEASTPPTLDPMAITSLMAPNAPNNQNTSVIQADPTLDQTRAQNANHLDYPSNQANSNQPMNQPAGRSVVANQPIELPPSAKQELNIPTDTLDIRKIATPKIEASPSSAKTMAPLTDYPNQTEPSDDEGSVFPKQSKDERLTLAMQAKANGEPKQVYQTTAPSRDSVSLHELTKMGVKDIAYSVEPNTPPPPALQDTPPPLPAPTVTTPTQAQTTTNTAANSETNATRRTIAADIRLRALERMVVAAARAGTETLTLQLYPPGLGQIMIRLVMDGQRLRIVTRAANAEAVTTLKEMEGDLRDALAGNGLDLAAFDVTDEHQTDEQERRQKAGETAIKTTSGGKNESFTVDLNA